MKPTIITVSHGLKIVPLHRVVKYAVEGTRVHLHLLGGADNALAIPGTIKVATSVKDGIISKKITYQRSHADWLAAGQLNRYRGQRLIALYADETGQMRVCGSPEHPLRLEYVDTGGVFEVTLTGESTALDAFLSE